MEQTVQIPIEQYKCLRGHLEEAAKIFNSLGIPVGSSVEENRTPNRLSKETKSQKVKKYKNLIASGTRGTKPSHLKK